MAERSSPLVAGSRFHGFEIVGALARTLLSQVVLARAGRTGALVALKLPSCCWRDEPAMVADRFRREETLGQQLRHENLVHMLPGPVSGPPMVVMEYVPGRSLRDELTDVGRIDARRAVALVRQLCGALAYLHDRRIVHGSVRPEHVWVTARGRVKLLDLGGVRVEGRGDEEPGSVWSSGGCAYCAPEQLRGRRPDPSSDVYGVGAVLYEMLTGVSPFAGMDPAALTRAKACEDPRAPGCLVRIDAALEWIVLRAMARGPRERQRSVRELAAELADPAAAVARLHRLPWQRRGSSRPPVLGSRNGSAEQGRRGGRPPRPSD